ncbi:protein translocase subunit SecF [Candidatus Falkowbacteria bacterium]|jgi:preprotein translocase subunit SecF|nr:protein translocase subunit SecF [Candidatus Falkowbacteria bacterium]MBT4432879.1 protein translocase subunit SecF [Candidatus Falkowbacteria bacterium]
MNIINYKKIYFIISGALVTLSVFGLIFWGLNLGIDFTGGSLLEIEYTGDRSSTQEVKDKLSNLDLGEISVQPIGEKGMLLRFKDVSEDVHQNILTKLNEHTLDLLAVENTDADEVIAPANSRPAEKIIEKRFDSIGPVIGQELRTKTIYAIIIALLMIILFISWAFRKVSKPISSWKYGVIAIIALFHDILIVLGIFVFLGKFFSIEVNAPFVAALLTILGYSVNDTIVIFDRVRENLKHYDYHFDNTVNKSVNQNLLRSVYTSVTTLLVLSSLYFFGGETIKSFVLALIIGVVIGTYSSIFLASPLLVVWEKLKRK